MRKVALFFVGIIGIAVAVFGGNLLFVEYQEYKLKSELEKEMEQKESEEVKIAQQLALQNLEFSKPILQNNNEWYIEINNTSSGNVFGSLILQLLDENDKVVLEEYIYLDSKMVKPHDKYIYNGNIAVEKAKSVKNYKVIENDLYYYY